MANMLHEEIYFSDGLKEQDARLSQLMDLFEQLQLATTDACHPKLDLITFAQQAVFFSVILKDRTPPVKKPIPAPKGDQMKTCAPGAESWVQKHAIDVESVQETTAQAEAWEGQIALGLVYLTVPFQSGHPLHDNELSIGITLHAAHQGLGHARRAIEHVLDIAFRRLHIHRVQAILPDHVAKDRAICLFTQMRFSHEGVRRRAFFSPLEREYKNVTYMAILDTEWMMRSSLPMQPAPHSVWEEMLARHDREREELLNWEENRSPIRRTSSMATVRGTAVCQTNMTPLGDSIGTMMAWDDPETQSDPESESSSASSTRSLSPVGYYSSDVSSSWDVLDSPPSSASLSSGFDSEDSSSMFEFIHEYDDAAAST